MDSESSSKTGIPMRTLDDAEVAEVLPWGDLIGAIEQVMVNDAAFAPTRTVHTVPDGRGNDAVFLLKPGWIAGTIIGLKAVTVFPDNGELDLPMVQAGFLLFDGSNGSLIGACEAGALTARRTAAASAVAAKRLARADAERLLIIGTGEVAEMAAHAHCTVGSYDTVDVWGRRPERVVAVVADLCDWGLNAVVSTDLDRSVAAAGVISAATGATAPLIKGALLAPGTHVDLIGAFDTRMRESDDDVVRRASIFVDSRDDAVLAGDLAQPLAEGVITSDAIRADLADLVAGRHPGRVDDTEITMFKSVGTALEDLAAASLAFR